MSDGIQIAAQADRFAGTALPRVLREVFANNASASTSSSQEAVAHSNPAVAACSRAHRQARDQAKASGKGFYEVSTASREAFRRAMPPLDSPANITDFIACVAHGLLLEIISDSDSARLLYAAQVASSAARLHTKSSGRPPKAAPQPTAPETTGAEAAPLPENQ
jgi:acyl-CoA synthetase (NDP forming)